VSKSTSSTILKLLFEGYFRHDPAVSVEEHIRHDPEAVV
jgi:hypothetical protein